MLPEFWKRIFGMWEFAKKTHQNPLYFKKKRGCTGKGKKTEKGKNKKKSPSTTGITNLAAAASCSSSASWSSRRAFFCCCSFSSSCQWQHLQSVDYIKRFLIFKGLVWRGLAKIWKWLEKKKGMKTKKGERGKNNCKKMCKTKNNPAITFKKNKRKRKSMHKKKTWLRRTGAENGFCTAKTNQAVFWEAMAVSGFASRSPFR